MANSCLWTLLTCVIFVPNQQSLRLASSSTWSRGFFLIWESTTCAKGQIITLLKIWLTFASLGAFVIFRMCVCVCRKIFSGKNHSLRSQHRTLTLEVVLFKYNLSHQNCLSLFLSLKGTYPHTQLWEKTTTQKKKKKMKATLKKKKEMYDCKIMSRISSSLRFIPLFPLWEN